MSAAPRARREELAVAALAVLPLLPFLSKAISLDGPVFVAVARQILEEPLDPFGFQMVWDMTSPEAARFNRNPPLLSYYLAPWMALFGESELALHAALLPFPLVAALAFLGIARRAGLAAPAAAAALLVTTPAFGLLASSLLLDVPVLACMLLAVYALLRGAADGALRWPALGGAAAAAAGLVKYVGFATFPLLAAGVVLLYPRRRAAAAAVLLGVPLAAWVAWGAGSAHLYGAPHFWAATDVLADKSFDPDHFLNKVLSTPIYYGAALVFPVLAWAQALLRPGRGSEIAVIGVLLGTATAVFVLPGGEPARRIPLEPDEGALAALGFAGALTVWALALDPRRLRRGPLERFLALWLWGLLVFSALLNWHVNAADALLAAPPALLLLFRDAARAPPRRRAALWAALQLALSALLGWADAAQANSYRSAAHMIAAEIGPQPGARWFVGHWGLQHYLEREGFRPVPPPSFGPAALARGDWVVSARNVSQIDVRQSLRPFALRAVWTWPVESRLPLRTTNGDAGSGFYSHHSGYVPFGWSRAPLEVVSLGRVVAVRR